MRRLLLLGLVFVVVSGGIAATASVEFRHQLMNISDNIQGYAVGLQRGCTMVHHPLLAQNELNVEDEAMYCIYGHPLRVRGSMLVQVFHYMQAFEHHLTLGGRRPELFLLNDMQEYVDGSVSTTLLAVVHGVELEFELHFLTSGVVIPMLPPHYYESENDCEALDDSIEI